MAHEAIAVAGSMATLANPSSHPEPQRSLTWGRGVGSFVYSPATTTARSSSAPPSPITFSTR